MDNPGGPMKAVDRETLAAAIAYALARADLPATTETSHDYAVRLAPLVIESGYLAALPDAAPSGVCAWTFKSGWAKGMTCGDVAWWDVDGEPRCRTHRNRRKSP